MILNELKDLLVREQLFLEPRLTLADLAEHSGFKVHYISQAINQVQEQNFFDFINQRRIEYACDLLIRESRQPVNILQVAMQSGFNSKSSFYNVFKKQLGQTPTQFRKAAEISPNL